MPDPTFNTADTNDATLENFFSRPIKVQTYSWGTGTSLFESFNPWQDFWENPRVINRITNYNLLRCKLKVKFVLNGNGFHYGRAIASYTPLHLFDQFTKDRAFLIEDVVAASQRPHIYLDPTQSQGGTLTLPFLWESNALDIPNQDWRSMGKIIVHGMQSLKHANGASDQVSVSVFVWAEEVSISIPTANEPGALAPQAGPMGSPDEYGKGPISRPAGTIARAAGALANIPGIALYAKATQMAASAVSSIATMFGFSRPNVITDIQPSKLVYLGNMVNANAHDTATKLTYDVKQELSIDPRTFGLGSADEMTIKSIVTRESYLTQFPWTVAAATETLLWNTEVTPVVWSEVNTGVDEIHLPACAFATLPFRNWRGTMKYRFQVVASSFHKGRIKIVFDPSYPATNEYNTNYTYIIDLAKERDFTVEVGWGQQFSFLKHRSPAFDNPPFSETKLPADPAEAANGILSVYVVNELTVPNSTTNNDIAVNVFVSAGDDFEVANPDDYHIKQLSWFAPQAGPMEEPQVPNMIHVVHHSYTIKPDYYLVSADGDWRTIQAQSFCGDCGQCLLHCDCHDYDNQSGEMQADADLTVNESAPMMPQVETTMGPDLTSSDHTMDVYFGDPITSFRQVLKRYNYHGSLFPGIDGNRLVTFTIGNFPYYRGFAPGAIHSTSLALPYNFANMTTLNWVTPAYTVWRGGLRWKYHYMGENGGVSSHCPLLRVERNPSSTFATSQSHINLPSLASSLSTRAAFTATNIGTGMSGMHATSARQNPVLEVELPFHSIDRFGPAKQANLTGTVTRTWYHKLQTYFWNDSDGFPEIQTYCSTGEDFTLALFTGAPVCYRQIVPVPG